MARLANANRRLSADLCTAQTRLLKDAAMLEGLKSIAAELKSEAASFVDTIKERDAIIPALQKDLSDVLSLIKGAHANTKATMQAAVAATKDLGADVKAIAATVTAAVEAGVSTISVTTQSTIADGATLVGTGIADGTTVKVLDAAAGTLSLSAPTTATIPAGATLNVSTPAG